MILKSFSVVGLFSVLCFGFSVFLWSPIARIPIVSSMYDVPSLFVHHLFSLEFIVLFPVLVVWVCITVHSIREALRSNIKLMTLVSDNFHEVFLAASTLGVAFSGIVCYLRPLNYWNVWTDWMSIILMPSYGLGILFCIIAWVIYLIAKLIKLKVPYPKQHNQGTA